MLPNFKNVFFAYFDLDTDFQDMFSERVYRGRGGYKGWMRGRHRPWGGGFRRGRGGHTREWGCGEHRPPLLSNREEECKKSKELNTISTQTERSEESSKESQNLTKRLKKVPTEGFPTGFPEVYMLMYF